MLYVVVHEKGGQTQRFDFGGDQFAIGREEDNDLVLDRVNVSKHHLRFRRHEGKVECIDLESTNGTYINGRRVEGARTVRRADRIYVGDYILMLEGDEKVIDPAESIESLTARVSKESRPRFADLSADESSLVTSAKRVAAAGIESSYLDKIADRIIRDVLQAAPRLDPVKAPKRSDVPDEDRSKALAKLEQAIAAVKATLEDGVDIEELEQRLAAELLEYGPLSSLMRDDTIREIHVAGAGPIHVVREVHPGDRLENLRFTVPRALGLAIRRLARKRGLWFEGAQIIEGVVDHGFHMHALLPPHQAKNPVLCLRRIKTDAKSLAALVSESVLSDDMRDFLLLMLRNSRRVIVSASGGVNLNRFMQALVGEIPINMRVALISDGGLLGRQHRGWIQVRRMPDPADTMSLSSVIGLLLRGGLDLLVSHQVSPADAPDVLDALAGASRGAVVSLWGVSAAHSLSRLAAFGTSAGGGLLPLTTALAQATDVVVQLNTGVNGESMQIREITAPRVEKDGTIDHRVMFSAERDGKDGSTQFKASRKLGQALRELGRNGIEIPPHLLKA